MSEPRPAEVRRGMAVARAVVEEHAGRRAARVVRERGGLTNLVFTAKHPDGDLVVRLSQTPEKLAVFQRECLAMARARAAGVPCPDVLALGERAPYSYMLVARAKGRPATSLYEREGVLRQLGEHAARINALATAGFGGTLAALAGEGAQQSWSEFVRDELDLDERLATLEQYDMLPSASLAKLGELLTRDEARRPALNHGDLRLKNVLVDKAGTITAILDWEQCTSALAPEWEWSLALHDLNIDEKQLFLEGYGANAASIERHMPLAKALNLVNYAPKVGRRGRAGDDAALGHLRVRLRGLLDLYAF